MAAGHQTITNGDDSTTVFLTAEPRKCWRRSCGTLAKPARAPPRRMRLAGSPVVALRIRVPCRPMRARHAYELSPGEPAGAVAAALAEVEAGQVAYLTRASQPIAALVPVAELADLQHASDAAALAEAATIRNRPGPRIPHDVVEAMMAADDVIHDAMAAALDARAGDDLPPGEVTAIWEAVSARRSA